MFAFLLFVLRYFNFFFVPHTKMRTWIHFTYIFQTPLVTHNLNQLNNIVILAVFCWCISVKEAVLSAISFQKTLGQL